MGWAVGCTRGSTQEWHTCLAHLVYGPRPAVQLLKEREGSISIKELSDLTMFKTDDIISTLQHLNMIQYQKGQHVICAAPHLIEQHLHKCGSPGLEVDPTKIVWVPFDARADYAQMR